MDWQHTVTIDNGQFRAKPAWQTEWNLLAMSWLALPKNDVIFSEWKFLRRRQRLQWCHASWRAKGRDQRPDNPALHPSNANGNAATPSQGSHWKASNGHYFGSYFELRPSPTPQQATWSELLSYTSPIRAIRIIPNHGRRISRLLKRLRLTFCCRRSWTRKKSLSSFPLSARAAPKRLFRRIPFEIKRKCRAPKLTLPNLEDGSMPMHSLSSQLGLMKSSSILVRRWSSQSSPGSALIAGRYSIIFSTLYLIISLLLLISISSHKLYRT